MNKPVLVIHGGAITDVSWDYDPVLEKKYHTSLRKTLEQGYAVLTKGESAVDAVEAAVNVLEDEPYFNAGKGSAFTHDGKNELDASIMDGKTLDVGAVINVTRIKNPIQAARIIMEKSPHVILRGDGAEEFVIEHGMKTVDPEYFFTETKWKQYLELLEEEKKQKKINPFKPSTVGAVALDRNGNIAAATSTGGLENKHYGRVGDSPIIGAGTYANNNTCAISCTGYGEYFIRGVVAYDISAQIEYKNVTLAEAAKNVILEKQKELWKREGITAKLGAENGSIGGVIGVDTKGNFTMLFNSAGMYRGYADQDGNMKTYIFQ